MERATVTHRRHTTGARFTLSTRSSPSSSMPPRQYISLVAIGLTIGLVGGCVSLPKNTSAVQPFALDRYLGRWYEAARLDHRFESGLDCVTATYSRREDGGVRVVNRGINLEDGEASESVGKAYFVKDSDTGRFKVSFFGPFYAGYNILALDHGYRHALVAGPNRDYLWILSRTPKLDSQVHQRLIDHAHTLGFPTDELIFPDQGRACGPYRKSGPQSSLSGHNTSMPESRMA